jgi:AcrR family transcriptional regulator
VNVSSHSLSPPRRIPQQPRGRLRVARLLRAADRVIGEAGYESATMCAIAERAGSSVGSLYQFFPNKDAVAEALRAQYAEEYAEFWRRFTPQAAGLDAEHLAARLIQFPLEFAARHPAFVPLLDIPPTARSSRRRQMIRGRIADVLRARRPQISEARAQRVATVVHQMLKGLLTLYAQAGIRERAAIIGEYKTALAGYLQARLCG